MSFAKIIAVDFKVVFCKTNPTLRAGEAMRMVFLSSIRLQVLPFDTQIAFATQGAIQLVVVSAAVWCIIDDIEFGCWERCPACLAGEAFFVVSTG